MKNFNIKSFSGGDSLRERTVDYIQIAKNVLDSYPLGLPHGIQKDAIQNGWDACINKKREFVSKNWKFEFELIERPDSTLLIMSDFGTSGLTGKMTTKDINDNNMPTEQEKWARWESLAFAKSSEDDLGARGQGKMILISASKDYMIIYDSLRKTDGYRMGSTQASKMGCPVYSCDGEDGKKEIKSILNIDPIDHVGTRIIIVNPVEEVISSIKSGEFLSFIEETWWPIIYKLGGKITLKYGGNTFQAVAPAKFLINDKTKETDNFKFWFKENIKIDFEKNQYIIKRLCVACYLNEEVSEINRGIAVFRGGMKIGSVDFPVRSFRNKVYGYIEFDNDVDKLLKKIELPNRYEFRNIGIWKKLKNKIEEELEIFGNKKLGLGINAKAIESARRNSAENKAMTVLRAITKDWPFARAGSGYGGGDDGGVAAVKEVGIRISNLIFPNPGNSPRLDYGDILDNFYTTIFNKKCEEVSVIFKGFVLSGDRVILNLDESKFKIESNGEVKTTEGYSIKINKKIFETPGEYRIKFILVDVKTKEKYHEIVRRIWIGVDPELKGPFDIIRLNFSELNKPEIKKMEWQLISEGDSHLVFYYNLEHPSYQQNDESDEKLSRYLSEIFCMGALQLLIKQAENNEIDSEKIKKLPFDVTKIKSGDLKIIYSEIVKSMSFIRFDIQEII